MDLLAENRSLIHAGKLLRQPDTGFEWSGWSELFVLLFDNYCKPKGRAGPAVSFIDCDVHSGHDKAQGEGWYHEVQCQPPSMYSFRFLCTLPRLTVVI